MKLQLTLLIILLPLWACSPSSVQTLHYDGITWRTLVQAKEEARGKNKPMLVDFFTSKECPRCQFLVSNIYSDPVVVERINRDFVPVRIDIDKPLTQEEKTLASRLESGEECILAFLTPQGSVVSDKQGKRICSMDILNTTTFSHYLDEALKNL